MNQDYLIHYGVKGMRWGQRRNRPKSPNGLSKRQQKKIAKSIVKNKGTVQTNKTINDRINKSKSKLKPLLKEWDKFEEEWEQSFHQNYRKVEADAIKKVKSFWDPADGPANMNNHQFNKAVGYMMDADPRMSDKQLSAMADKARDQYKSEVKKITDDLLGKYGKMTYKISETASKQSAEAALQSHIMGVVYSDIYKKK